MKMYIRGLDRVSPEGYVAIHPLDGLKGIVSRRQDLQKSLESYNRELSRDWGRIMRNHRKWVVGPNYWIAKHDPSYGDIDDYVDKYCPGTIKTTPKDVRVAFDQYKKALDKLENLFYRMMERQDHSIQISSRLYMFLTDSIFDFDLSYFQPLHV